MIDARDFLEAVSGYAQSTGSALSSNRPVKLGTVDPAYTSGLAKIKFDGETLVSQKGYAWAASYYPSPNDRVYLVPVGQSYIIGGKVETADNRFAEHRRAEFTTTGFSVMGGQSWDSGPVVLDSNSNKTKNNDFCQAGVSGAIKFTKAGYYTVSHLYVPTGNPGSGWVKLNHSVDGMQGMDKITEGQKHESYICLAPTWFNVDDYIRSQIYVSYSHTADSRWKVVAADQY